MQHPEDRLLVGIDWGAYEHRVCVVNRSGDVLGELTVASSGDGLAELVAWLTALTGGQVERAWVAIEVPHGPLVETLLDRGFTVLSINPKQVDRFRDRYTVAGAKDDRRDARVLADSLRSDPACYRRIAIDEAGLIELREWSRMSEELLQERIRESNRLREQLRRYYPQMLEIGGDLDDAWVLDLFEEVSTPERAARVQERTISKILKKRRIRKTTATQVLEILRRTPVHVAPGVTTAAVAHASKIVQRLRLINVQMADCERQMEGCLDRLASRSDEDSLDEQGEQHDVAIVQSMPGIGTKVGAVLLAEASAAIRERDYQGLRKRCGTAPVTKRSGRRHAVHMRHACQPRLRLAVYHWACVAMVKDTRARSHYAKLRAKGHSHGRALRGVADRLLGVLCAALKSRSLYDPSLRGAA